MATTTMTRIPRDALLAGVAALYLLGSASAFVGISRNGKSILSRDVHIFDRLPSISGRPSVSPTHHSTVASSFVTALSMWSQDDELAGSDRIKACIPYLLPLIDGDQFGKYIYERIPPLGAINEVTIGPLSTMNQNIPFLGLGFFLLLTLGTRFNMDMSRNVRFSAQQAAIIDISLIIPELLGSAFAEDPLPRALAEPCSNFVWYAYASVCIYCVYCNLRGKRPDVPFISGTADMMTGPF
jgi:hypothetical protein